MQCTRHSRGRYEGSVKEGTREKHALIEEHNGDGETYARERHMQDPRERQMPDPMERQMHEGEADANEDPWMTEDTAG